MKYSISQLSTTSDIPTSVIKSPGFTLLNLSRIQQCFDMLNAGSTPSQQYFSYIAAISCPSHDAIPRSDPLFAGNWQVTSPP